MKYITSTKMLYPVDPNTVYLIHDSWDDFCYRTSYKINYCDAFGKVNDLGTVKIGEFNLTEAQQTPNLPATFLYLSPERFFSLSSDDSYYLKIAAIPNEIGYRILFDLNDLSVSPEIFAKAVNEPVLSQSLFRYANADKEAQLTNNLQLLNPPLKLLLTMKRIYGSTGWEEIDRGLIEMQRLLYQSDFELYYNAIATIGRQVIIMMTNIVYDDEIHRDKTKYPQKPTDDKFINKLHGFIDYIYNDGCVSENLKNYIKSSIELVQGYVHKEKAERFESFMCVHAVITLVYQISILCRKEKYNAVLE